jgi:two-component system CheB/CheR fusion protein
MAAKKRAAKSQKAKGKPTPAPKPSRPTKIPKQEQESAPPPDAAGAEESPTKRYGFPVVGMCASAGGLDAFKKFFAAMPPASGIAFVLIPHLDPTHESLMPELIARQTSMTVVEAADGMRVAANCVYILPPNKYMTITGGMLHLTGPVERRGTPTSIDLFLRSLADDQQEKAICIILSGTGSHGTLGLKAIKAGGGMAMVQDPATADHDQMPRSAISTGLADYVLPVEKMPEPLIRYTKHPYINDAKAPTAAAEAPGHLGELLSLLRTGTRFDFRFYTREMLLGPISRRMGSTHHERLPEYLTFARGHPDELTQLARELLISATNFFHDPNAYRALETDVIAPLVRAKPPDAPIRVWVPGCATGQEPYSIGMLLLEQLAAVEKSCYVQIYATDVDENALETARRAIYPESIAADVSPGRLERFFTRTGDSTYQVNSQLRGTVVFALQNLLTDVPFSRMDLISCRNVLIYLNPEVQSKVVNLLHSALNEGGYLFLGSSETTGKQSDIFEPISSEWRIYRRIGASRPERVYFPLALGHEILPPRQRPTEPSLHRPASYAELTNGLLLKDYGPAAVLIDRGYQVLYFSGPTTRYLKAPAGAPTRDLIMMAREGLRTALRAALHKAMRDREPVHLANARVKRNGSYSQVSITVKPVQNPMATEWLLLVTFHELSQNMLPTVLPPPEVQDSAIRQLEFELKATKEELQRIIEEAESSNEELKASNEEVMSTNEELQSINEELESSKEELLSLNEELSMINSQLHDKFEELESTNNDLANLFDCTDIATVFLDLTFRIKRFTPAATRLFKLIPADVGRDIGDIASSFTDPRLLADASQVLLSSTPSDREIRSEDGHWWARRIVPYRTLDGRTEGLVLTFTDITSQKQRRSELEQLVEQRTAELALTNEKLQQRRSELEQLVEQRTAELALTNEKLLLENTEHRHDLESLRDSESRLRALFDTVVDAIIVIDENGVIQSVNPATEKLFGYAQSELVGRNVKILMPTPYREAHDSYLGRYVRTGEKHIIGTPREVSGLRKDGSVFPIDLAVSEVHGEGRLFTGILHDITSRKELEREIVEIAALEQRRIGADLHDNVGQELTALGLLADNLVEALGHISPANSDAASRVAKGLSRVLKQVRIISRGLLPVEVDASGLAAALEDLAARVSENSGVSCVFRSTGPLDLEDHLKARHLFLIAQEACSNALRHGQAKNIAISLGPHDHRLVLRIEDDGTGIPDRPQEGLGLRIMRNRASVIHGTLTIEALKPHGTVVTCTLFKDRFHESDSRSS